MASCVHSSILELAIHTADANNMAEIMPNCAKVSNGTYGKLRVHVLWLGSALKH